MEAKEPDSDNMEFEVNVTQIVIDLLNDLYDIQQRVFNENEDKDLNCTKFDSKWNELFKAVEKNKVYANSLFAAYYHLRIKGWTIGCGTKFGAHFLLYPQEKDKNKRNHSKYLVMHNFNIGNLRRLHAYIRLCKNIQKTLILTSFSDEFNSEINRKLLLNNEWLNGQTLLSMSCNLET